jgi:hypothetical protein
MYIRTIQRKNKDGSVVRYIQLAHNQWDPQAGCAKAKVLFNFGREEEVDGEALKRLVKSINRFLGPEEILRHETGRTATLLKFITSRPLGGAWLLDRLWEELGIKGVLEALLKKRQYKTPVERALFAMAANRALDPLSKRGVEEWVKEDVVISGVEEIPLQQLYRAMDFLLENEAELQKQVYSSVANLLNLEVDILYFDTTSTYFETEDEDEDGGLRRRGYSKDHRPDLPQAVIGLAVTRDGIPVRCWVWPGNTADISVVEQVKKDLVGWKLGRVITVLDRGFNSEDNLRYLRRAGGHYIAGEKLRSGKAKTAEALKRTRPLPDGAGQPGSQGDCRREWRSQGTLHPGAQPGRGRPGQSQAGENYQGTGGTASPYEEPCQSSLRTHGPTGLRPLSEAGLPQPAEDRPGQD